MEVGGTPLPDGQGQMGQEGHGMDAQEREKIAGPPARDVARKSEKMCGAERRETVKCGEAVLRPSLCSGPTRADHDHDHDMTQVHS